MIRSRGIHAAAIWAVALLSAAMSSSAAEAQPFEAAEGGLAITFELKQANPEAQAALVKALASRLVSRGAAGVVAASGVNAVVVMTEKAPPRGFPRAGVRAHTHPLAEEATSRAFMQAIASKWPPKTWPASLPESARGAPVVVEGGQARSTSRKVLAHLVKEVGIPEGHLVMYQGKPLMPGTLMEARTAPGRSNLNGWLVHLVKAEGIDPMGITEVRIDNTFVEQTGYPVVILTTDEPTKTAFHEQTRKYNQQQIALCFGDELYESFKVNEPIPGGRIQLQGSAGRPVAWLEALASRLRVGPLPEGLIKATEEVFTVTARAPKHLTVSAKTSGALKVGLGLPVGGMTCIASTRSACKVWTGTVLPSQQGAESR